MFAISIKSKYKLEKIHEENQKQTLNHKVQMEIERINELRARNYTKGDHFLFETKDFIWLIEKLTGQVDNKYFGCELNITETAIFRDGKP